jgi:hypothetical protein
VSLAVTGRKLPDAAIRKLSTHWREVNGGILPTAGRPKN